MPNKVPAQACAKPRLTTATKVAWLAAGLSLSYNEDAEAAIHTKRAAQWRAAADKFPDNLIFVA